MLFLTKTTLSVNASMERGLQVVPHARLRLPGGGLFALPGEPGGFQGGLFPNPAKRLCWAVRLMERSREGVAHRMPCRMSGGKPARDLRKKIGKARHVAGFGRGKRSAGGLKVGVLFTGYGKGFPPSESFFSGLRARGSYRSIPRSRNQRPPHVYLAPAFFSSVFRAP